MYVLCNNIGVFTGCIIFIKLLRRNTSRHIKKLPYRCFCSKLFIESSHVPYREGIVVLIQSVTWRTKSKKKSSSGTLITKMTECHINSIFSHSLNCHSISFVSSDIHVNLIWKYGLPCTPYVSKIGKETNLQKPFMANVILSTILAFFNIEWDQVVSVEW